MLDSGKLRDFAPGEGVAASAFAERFDSSNWIDVPVPGDVHRALMTAGRIEDPFYDRNEEECAWMEGRGGRWLVNEIALLGCNDQRRSSSVGEWETL